MNKKAEHRSNKKIPPVSLPFRIAPTIDSRKEQEWKKG